MNTIADQIHERANLITAIINKRNALNRITLTPDEWNAAYYELNALHIDQLKTLN